ncbi:MAG: proton-conducting transporter membrane subunit [Candidatus Margulisbacteria bacterium]|nr:proton-conducting transporter membrane subunit [Candidatus Margulisiibacteriota bacterium]
MNILLYIIFLPILAALLCWLFKRSAAGIALIASAIVLILAGLVFWNGGAVSQLLTLRATPFSAGVFLAAAFFTLLIVLYSTKFMAADRQLDVYYGNIMITLGAAAGAVFASDYLTLLFFWGVLGITLYLLVGTGGDNAGSAAKKTLIIVGGADALMIFGLGLIYAMTGSVVIGAVKLPLTSVFPILAFLAMAAGVFAKAGAVPLHTWIPDSAEVAPVTVMAYLPAALDKLLGIYLLARLTLDVFTLVPNSAISITLMALGSLTIMTAVMAALVQHNLKKLLSFHAVSQVGYMVLGIGTGIPVAVAGGIFHMFNHTIYKSLLFLGSGAIEKQTGSTELDRLGGLARFMPITFGSMLIAALAISGVPPLNGFFSKWMIYQGVIELSKTSNLWIVWLVAAMFGSALTLASFIKVIHSVFLGQWSELTSKAREVAWPMWLPLVLLALLCIIFGIFAYSLPIPYLVATAVPAIKYSGFFNPVLATALILVGLLIGLLIYYFMSLVGTTTPTIIGKPAYIGGELMEESEIKISGTEFYNTIKETGPLTAVYGAAEKQYFDLYEIGRAAAFKISEWLSWLHNGLLSTYLFWLLLGAVVLFFYLVR